MSYASMTIQDRVTLLDELAEKAQDLLWYWERHGDDPETVSKWAVEDLTGILRFIVEGGK